MIKLFISALLLFTINSSYKFEQDKILGNWQTEGNKAKVHIFKREGLIHGKIISVSDTKNNSKIGLVVLKNFKPNGNLYENGTILEPEHNHEIDGLLTITNDGKTLKVKGSSFLGLISKTETWKKIN